MLVNPWVHRALRRGQPLILLIEIDLATGTERFWSGLGKLGYGGHVWHGAGIVGSIQTSPQSQELRIDEVRLVLAGVLPEEYEAIDLTDIRNREARTYIAALGDDVRVTGQPIMLDIIRLDYIEESVSEDGTLAIALVGQTGFWTLERTTETAWSREEAIRRWGTDTGGAANESGFDYITSLRVKDTKWQAPDP